MHLDQIDVHEVDGSLFMHNPPSSLPVDPGNSRMYSYDETSLSARTVAVGEFSVSLFRV